MIKRNWSIWLLLILVLGGILVQFFQDRVSRDERISIEDVRRNQILINSAISQDTTYGWDEAIPLLTDESLSDVSAYNGTAYYVTAVNQLREQYAYTYRLYRYGTETEKITELPDAKPHRLTIVAVDGTVVLLAKEYSDGKTSLVSYHVPSGQYTVVSQWDGPPSRAQISYFQNTIGLVIDNTWGIYNLQGQPRPVQKRLPAGAVVRSLGVGPTESLIYYEVNELRYLMLYHFSSQQMTSWLVNDRVLQIQMQSGWAITQGENTVQMYSWPNLSVQRLDFSAPVRSIRIISDRFIDIRFMGARHRPFIFDMLQRELLFNQAVDPIGDERETIYYYYVPAVSRINRLRFID